jgi:hypothetical protein
MTATPFDTVIGIWALRRRFYSGSDHRGSDNDPPLGEREVHDWVAYLPVVTSVAVVILAGF